MTTAHDGQPELWAFIDLLRGEVDTLRLENAWLHQRLLEIEHAGERVHLDREDT